MHANNNVARFPDDHNNDEPPLYEAIHNKQPDRARDQSTVLVTTQAVPVLPVPHNPISRPSAATCEQVQQTILKLIRALVLNASPSPKFLDSCADACQTYRVDFSAILQKKFINDHCAVHWAILMGHDSLTRSLLAYAAPITQSTKLDVYHACLAISNQNLFHSLRCWRASLGDECTPLSTSSDTDKLVLGSTPADEVSVTEIPGQAALVANMQINLWQKRMRIAGRVLVEFIGLGRIWRLAFYTPSPGVVGKWMALLCLLEYSPPTFVDARLVIDPPPLSSDSSTSKTTDLISLSPDDSTSPSATRSVTGSKVGRTMVLHFESPYHLAHRDSTRVEQWKDDDGYTCTNCIVVPLHQGASAELSYDNTPLVASDGTLYARLEAWLESPKKPEVK